MFAIGDKEWPGVSKVLEEMGELAAELGKLMGTRGDTNHWTGDLRERIVNEMADVMGAISFLAEQNLTHAEQVTMGDRIAQKFDRFRDWHVNEQPVPKDRP